MTNETAADKVAEALNAIATAISDASHTEAETRGAKTENVAEALCGISSALHRIAEVLESGEPWKVKVEP